MPPAKGFKCSPGKQTFQPGHFVLDPSPYKSIKLFGKEDNGVFPLVIKMESLGSDKQAVSLFYYCTFQINEQEELCKIKVNKEKLQMGSNAFVLEEVYESQVESETKGGETSQCIICLSNISNIILYPCRHFCLCDQCSNFVKVDNKPCPICRKQIENFILVKP
jgi:E3 ubiquitin-protein ligase MGRN1